MDRFARIAERIAAEVLADADVFVVIDENGVNEVDSGEFHNIFASTNILAAKGGKRKKEKPQSRTQIFFSPEINATNPPKDGFLAGMPTRIENFLNSVLQRLYAKKYIDEVVLDSYDDNRTQHLDDTNKATRTYPIGYTIQKAAGSYPTMDKETGKPVSYSEPSYVVTLYGLSNAESERIAKGLKDKFRQESVIIDKGKGGFFRF